MPAEKTDARGPSQPAGRCKFPPDGYAAGMRNRSSERGNTILIATVLILGLTVMGLGLAKFVRSYAEASADRKGAGYPALQALAAAEMGINDVMYRSNEPAVAGVPAGAPTGPAMPAMPVSLAVTIAYSPTYTITPTVRYTVTYLGSVAGPIYQYRSEGTVTPGAGQSGWGVITRRIRFDVRSAGGNWVVENYAHE